MRTREITLGAVALSLVCAFVPQISTTAVATGNSLPSGFSANSASVPTPANQPEDLVSLARTETQSVVTVQCGTEVGSGWSAQVNLNSQLKANGYKSYLITNYHVVKGCLQNQSVQITLIDQSKVTGYVWAWDEMKDVASIATIATIPALPWIGDQPANGWWVGILGSPLGFPGVLTEGIVSSVNSSLSRVTTSAPINPGNSGGPAFDRVGRVIGIATAKYANSEGMGILNGTPLFCGTVVDCAAPAEIWNTAPKGNTADQAKVLLSTTPVTSSAENQLNQAAVMLLTSTRRMLAQSLENLNEAIADYPDQKNALLKVIAATPKDPVIDNSVDDVLEVALFANQVTSFMKTATISIASAKATQAKPVAVINTQPKVTSKVKAVSSPIVSTVDPKISSTATGLKKSPAQVKIQPKTITCVNTFKSIKVTAINAKCPLGYNLKAIITM